MSFELIVIDEFQEQREFRSDGAIDRMTNNEKATSVKSNNCGLVDELCTCVGFFTCQDPDHYDTEVSDGIIEIDNNNTNQISAVSRDPPNPNMSQPDPPQPDPPATTHSVLVHRTRNNQNETTDSSVLNEASSILPPGESFDVIVYSSSKEHQYVATEIGDGQNCSTSSPMTTTSSTVQRYQRPEEYEPLIMILDDDEVDHYKMMRDNQLSPISNRAVRDTSSTSSLQYHRRSPMMLSYASPKHVTKDMHQVDLYSRRNHHQRLHSLVEQEIERRISRKSNRERKEISLDRYNEAGVDDDRYGYEINHRYIDQSRDVKDISMSPASSIVSSVVRNHPAYRQHQTHRDTTTRTNHNTISPVNNVKLRSKDTDTVRAVAPSKLSSYENEMNLSTASFQEHYHLPPTDQVIICAPPRSPKSYY